MRRIEEKPPTAGLGVDLQSGARAARCGNRVALRFRYVAAPAGTRIDVVKKLSDEIVAGIGAEPALRRIRGAGASELPRQREHLTQYMVTENKKWKYVIDAAKLQRQ